MSLQHFQQQILVMRRLQRSKKVLLANSPQKEMDLAWSIVERILNASSCGGGFELYD